MAQSVPDVLCVELDRPHALVLRPVRSLVAAQALVAHPLGQHEHTERRQRDACEAGELQPPPDGRGGGADHGFN